MLVFAFEAKDSSPTMLKSLIPECWVSPEQAPKSAWVISEDFLEVVKFKIDSEGYGGREAGKSILNKENSQKDRWKNPFGK